MTGMILSVFVVSAFIVLVTFAYIALKWIELKYTSKDFSYYVIRAIIYSGSLIIGIVVACLTFGLSGVKFDGFINCANQFAYYVDCICQFAARNPLISWLILTAVVGRSLRRQFIERELAATFMTLTMTSVIVQAAPLVATVEQLLVYCCAVFCVLLCWFVRFIKEE